MLLQLGETSPAFVEKSLDLLRICEGQIRDEYGKIPCTGPPPPVEGFGTGKEGRGNSLPAAFEKGAQTPIAPSGGEGSPKVVAKEENPEEENKEPLTDADEGEKPEQDPGGRRERARGRNKESEGKKGEDPQKKYEKASSSKPGREKEGHRRRRRTPNSEADPRERRSRRRRREESEERERTRSPRSTGGKEKKTRDGKPPEPAEPPSWVRSPASGATPKAKGVGWIGDIPYSSHPRWTESKNKGITKRAKQEVHNSYPYYRGRGRR